MASPRTRHTRWAATWVLETGVDLRDVQVAARHADPRTTMRYDRATTLDRHPNYILAAYMASGTPPSTARAEFRAPLPTPAPSGSA